MLEFRSMPLARLGSILLISLVFSGVVTAGQLEGTVDFLTRRGQRPNRAETLVWLESGQNASTPEPGTYRIRTLRKTLVPHVLAVPMGSTVEFPNEDPISHNLFSLSAAKKFDLGFYRRGAGKSETFDKPGVVNVYCNVHPDMSAVIHIMATPYYVFTDAKGAFSFADVEPGKYQLFAWNEVGGTSSIEVVVPGNGSRRGVEITIDSRSHRDTQHLNKEGKPYQRSRRRDY